MKMKFEWVQYWEQQKDISMERIITRTTWSDLPKRLLEPLNRDRSIKLLEAGCGSGSIALWLIDTGMRQKAFYQMARTTKANGKLEVKKTIKYADLTFSKHFGKILARNVGIIGRKKF